MTKPCSSTISRTRTLALVLVAGCATAAGGPGAERPSPVPTTATSSTVLFADRSRPQPATLVELLQGRVPGLRVERRSGGRISLEMRGPGSLHAGEPLVVIDGWPLPCGPGLDGFLSTINPADVIRVDVLRDASATAVYGPSATNGVLLITLRHRGR